MVRNSYRSWGRWIGSGLTAFALICSTGISADDQIEAHLGAGEFGKALQLAQQLDGADKDAALKKIAHAQAENGELSVARRTLGQMQDRKASATEQHQLGGGVIADFQSLITLIQKETEGPWDDDEPGTGTISQFDSGVRVDPKGVLYRQTREEQTGRLAALGVEARTASLNEDMSRHSDLRMVSLTRLEAEVARRLDAGEPVVESMKKLAGLSQIKYVFFYPESQEIVIAGPAEGWKYDANGVAIGT